MRTRITQNGPIMLAERANEREPIEGVLIGRDWAWTRESRTYRDTGIFTFTSDDAFTSSTVWESIDGL